MGILAEIDQAKISFGDPGPMEIGFDTKRKFGYSMPSFEIQFGIRFDPDPAVGVGGSPATQENWQIGIIQNLLYARYRFEYEHPPRNREFFQEFPLPSVDMVDGAHSFPFYADQKNQPGTLITRPVSDIIYTSKGYREKSSKSVNFDNSPSFFNMWDQPGGAAPFTLRSDDATPLRLLSLEKVLIFQTWLVAMKTGAFATTPAIDKIRQIFIPKLLRSGTGIAILAYIPPFSLNFWADVDLAHFRPRSSFDDPNVTWGVYGDEGYFPNKPINRRRTGLGPNPTVKPRLGDGGRSPVITGSTSLMASRSFLQMHGLDPK